MSFSIFLPSRKGSVRVKNKNTRSFSDIEGGLLELKLRQLARVNGVEAIVLSTNDDESIRIGENHLNSLPSLKIVPRPKELCSSTTDLSDLIEYAGNLFTSEDILWTHVTSPFCDESIYQKAIEKYSLLERDKFDSLVGVQSFQNFLWDPEAKVILNKNGSTQWPNTQDLKCLFEINNAIFIAPRQTYRERRNRIGERPYLFTMNKITSLDIDVEEDFTIAEALYEHLPK